MGCSKGTGMATAICFILMLQGFLLPLCAAGDCSLREAVIVAAVLRRVSLPVRARFSKPFCCSCQSAVTNAS